MIALALCALLSTSTTTREAGDAPRLLVLNIEAAEGDEDEAKVLVRLVTAALDGRRGVQATDANELRRVVDVEAERQAMGCSAESCLREVADAFGADLVVFGDITRTGRQRVLSLSLFEASSARARARFSTELSDHPDLQGAANDAAAVLVPMAGPLFVTVGGATAGAGLVVAGAGLGLTVWSFAVLGDAASAGIDKQNAQQNVLPGEVAAVAGVSVAVVGAGVMVYGLLFADSPL